MLVQLLPSDLSNAYLHRLCEEGLLTIHENGAFVIGIEDVQTREQLLSFAASRCAADEIEWVFVVRGKEDFKE